MDIIFVPVSHLGQTPLSSHLDNGEDTVNEGILIQDNPQPYRAPLCDDTGLGANEGEDVDVDNESVHNV